MADELWETLLPPNDREFAYKVEELGRSDTLNDIEREYWRSILSNELPNLNLDDSRVDALVDKLNSATRRSLNDIFATRQQLGEVATGQPVALTDAAVSSVLSDPTSNSRSQVVGKGELVLSVLDDGALPNSNSDSTSAIQTTLDRATKTVLIPAGIYRCNGILRVPGSRTLTIQGDGIDQTVIDHFGSLSWFSTSQTSLVQTTVVSALKAGDSLVSLQSSNGVSVGQLIVLRSTQTMPETTYTLARTHSAIVSQVRPDNVVVLDRPVPCDFDLSGYTISVSTYSVGRIELRDMTIRCGDSDIQYLTELAYSAGFTFTNVKFSNRAMTYQGKVGSGAGISAIRLRDSVDAYFNKCEFEFMHYCIMPTGGAHTTTVTDNTARRCRHLVAPTGGAQGTTVRDSNAYDCYAGFDSHQTAYDSHFTNCKDYRSEIPSKFRGRSDIIRDSSFFGSGIELTNDPALDNISDKSGLVKLVDGCRIEGPISGTAYNKTIRSSYVKGYVDAWRPSLGGSFTLEDSLVDVSKVSFEGDYNVVRTAYYYRIKISGVTLLGPYVGINQTNGSVAANVCRGILVGTTSDGTTRTRVEGVVLDGFDHAIHVALGGVYSGYRFSDITVRNSVKGINGLANYKYEGPIFDTFKFEGVQEAVVEPFRFTHSPVASGGTSGLSQNRRIVWVSAQPVRGIWQQGDWALMRNPVPGSPIGWVCMTSGEPGVWSPMPSLS